MDQDGFSIAIFTAALILLASGLWTGEFAIQNMKVARRANSILYWIVAFLIMLVGVEAFRRALFIGCVGC